MTKNIRIYSGPTTPRPKNSWPGKYVILFVKKYITNMNIYTYEQIYTSPTTPTPFRAMNFKCIQKKISCSSPDQVCKTAPGRSCVCVSIWVFLTFSLICRTCQELFGKFGLETGTIDFIGHALALYDRYIYIYIGGWEGWVGWERSW